MRKAVLFGIATALCMPLGAQTEREQAIQVPDVQQHSEHGAHAQPEATQQGQPMQMSMQSMHQHMQAMDEQMARMRATRDPAERQRMMQDHMQSMHEHMGLMERSLETMQRRMDEMQETMDRLRDAQGAGNAAPKPSPKP